MRMKRLGQHYKEIAPLRLQDLDITGVPKVVVTSDIGGFVLSEGKRFRRHGSQKHFLSFVAVHDKLLS